jgi:hypothetical protein
VGGDLLRDTVISGPPELDTGDTAVMDVPPDMSPGDTTVPRGRAPQRRAPVQATRDSMKVTAVRELPRGGSRPDDDERRAIARSADQTPSGLSLVPPPRAAPSPWKRRMVLALVFLVFLATGLAATLVVSALVR